MECFVSPMRCTWRRLLFTRKWLSTGVSFQVKDRGVYPLCTPRQALCLSPQSPRVHVCQPCYVLKPLLPGCPPFSTAYALSASFSTVSLSSVGRFDGEHPFRSLTLHIVCLWISVCVPTCLRRWLLWWPSKTLVYEYSRMSLGLVLLLSSFIRRVVVVFPC